eukprot:TRINITY_DN31358_c0_g1_i1.p1 TRINITY_DN31358_c0_g1~~TRINITY_DN31358_c0_g1_i1.p1  ORF type:complete len:602 (-),score=31.69 TRINITY_DN31358_c0_g1_i1:587-2392(-)
MILPLQIGIFVILVQLVAVTIGLARIYSFQRGWNNVKRWWQALSLAKAVLDPIDEQVIILREKKRMERIEHISVYLLPALLVLLVLHLPLVLPALMSGDETILLKELKASGLLASHFGISALAAIIYFPNVFLKNCSIRVAHSSYLIVLLARFFFADDFEDYLWSSLWVTCVRIFMCIVQGDVPYTIVSSMVFAVASIATGFSSNVQAKILGMVILNYLIFVLVSAITFSVQSARDAELRATLQTKASARFKDVVSKTLANACDAVVHLSSSLTIGEASRQLMGLLLRSLPPETLLGTYFSDLLYDANDKARFANFMEEPIDTHSFMFLVNLKGPNSTCIRTHLFRASGLDVQDKPFHILGIKELEEPVSLSRVHVPTSPKAPDSHTSSSSRWSAPELPLQVSDGEVAAWVSVDSKCVEMQKCSPEFRSLIGPSTLGSDLFKVLKPADSVAFKLWLERASNELWNQHDEENEVALTIEFRIMHQRKRIRTKIIASLPVDDMHSDDGNVSLMKLVFTTIQFLISAREERRRRRQAPASSGSSRVNPHVELETRRVIGRVSQSTQIQRSTSECSGSSCSSTRSLRLKGLLSWSQSGLLVTAHT